MRQAADLQRQGRSGEAVNLLRTGVNELDFARCELTTNLAVILYTSGDKESAQNELESIQPLVDPASTPDCLRSQYLLGTLYGENGDTGRERAAFQSFLTNSANTKDPEILSMRQRITQQK